MHVHMKKNQSLGEALLDGIQRVAAMKPTYPLMWIGRFRKAIADHGATNQDAHGTYAGQCCYFVDADGQRYRVTVEPVKLEAAMCSHCDERPATHKLHDETYMPCTEMVCETCLERAQERQQERSAEDF